MKSTKKLILVAACTLIASVTSAQKGTSDDSQGKEMQAKNARGVSESQSGGNSEFQAYIKRVQEELAGNERRFAAIKAKVMSEKKNANPKSEKAIKKLEKNLMILEIANNELKTDLLNYIKYGKGDWTLFKREFNQELTEVGSDIRDLKVFYDDFIADNIK